MAEIDARLLPASALLDSSVLVPALDPGRKKPSDDPACADLFAALVKSGHRVMIAAPSAAEIIRRSPAAVIPRTRRVVVVPFDDRAANELGTKFPPEVLVSFAVPGKAPLAYIKYDAMIVACAIRHNAHVLVTTDAKQKSLAEKVGLVVRTPSFFTDGQTNMFEVFARWQATSPDPKQSKPEAPKEPK